MTVCAAPVQVAAQSWGLQNSMCHVSISDPIDENRCKIDMQQVTETHGPPYGRTLRAVASCAVISGFDSAPPPRPVLSRRPPLETREQIRDVLVWEHIRNTLVTHCKSTLGTRSQVLAGAPRYRPVRVDQGRRTVQLLARLERCLSGYIPRRGGSSSCVLGEQRHLRPCPWTSPHSWGTRCASSRARVHHRPPTKHGGAPKPSIRHGRGAHALAPPVREKAPET